MKYLAPFLVLLGCQLTLVFGQKNPYFRKDYVYFKEYNAFYKYHKPRLGFSDAVATCNAEGAEMYFPQNVPEINDIFKMINKSDQDGLWIGMHSLFGGGFTTLSGVPIDEVYHNWAPGEPNNAGGKEHCVALRMDTTFNDYECSAPGNFVCRKSAVNLTQNSACETYDLEYNFNIDLFKCYKLHKVPRTWTEAFRVCRAEGSEMVIINSDREAEFLMRELEKYPEKRLRGSFEKKQVHVGFNDLVNQGIYLTVDGKDLYDSGYEKWAPNQPDNNGGNERCGSMFRDGTLNDLRCDIRAMFFCEKRLDEPSKPLASNSGSSAAGTVVLLPDAK